MRKLGVRSGPILELEGGEVLPWAVKVAPWVEAASSLGRGLALDDDVQMEELAVFPSVPGWIKAEWNLRVIRLQVQE